MGGSVPIPTRVVFSGVSYDIVACFMRRDGVSYHLRVVGADRPEDMVHSHVLFLKLITHKTYCFTVCAGPGVSTVVGALPSGLDHQWKARGFSR